ncbi:hypothetical protein, partial [Streptomyces sp. NPDC017230]|uniref:hypothetical protein n=1 Tax=Streptomyces sp. NPDC017230 TaxID=3364984 RepID=UPI0037B19DCC
MRLTRVTLAVAAGALAPALLLATPSFAATPTPPSVAAAVDTGSPYDEMDADDLRVAIARTLADPASGRRVIREANELLDGATVEEMRAWLETGHRLAQAEDDQVAIVRLLSDPDSGRRVIKEINELLDTGTPEQMRAWLETGHRLAQAEDDQVAIVRLLGDPDSGRRVIKEINELLDTGTPEQMRAWLETG